MKTNNYDNSEIEVLEPKMATGTPKSYHTRFVNKKFSALHESIIVGYGACRSCDCRGYISKNNGSHTCKECDHHKDQHR